ncbi:MAG: SRPBCC family protein [Pseudonocardiaceae bacterium]|nr:MAG: SRPBCC family protein [Pseudonocardiaceae bacterium]
MRLTIAARGPVPAAEAWDRYARPARWTEWSPYLVGVESSTDGLRAGTAGRLRGPLRVTVPYTVTAVDEPARTWAWDVRFGPVRLAFDHGVEPCGAGSRTWLIAHGPLPVLALYLPVAWLSLNLLVRRR